jgi:deoxyribonuclease V
MPDAFGATTDFAALREQQRQIAARAVITGSLEQVTRFVALDMSSQSFYRGDAATMYAAAVLFERGNPNPLEVSTAIMDPPMPYRSGFLAFREAPVLEQALKGLSSHYDLLWLDGAGIAHPRRAGIATQLGVILDLPSLGVAKTRLVGEVGPLESDAGSSAPLVFEGDEVGFTVRLRKHSNPLFVSPGHRCSARAALDFVLEHSDGYRQPFPSRLAHEHANQQRRQAET